jgi:hypothetical protein
MALLVKSRLFALISFVSLSSSQQTAIITELPAYSSLSACAASAVSSAAVQFSNLWCRSITTPVSLAGCICLTWANSVVVSEEISQAVGTCTGGASLGGGSLELSSALSVLTTYCAAASQNNIGTQATVTTADISLTGTPSTSASPTTPVSTGSASVEVSAASSSSSGDDYTFSPTSIP